jgi:tryptophan-rich sensory protein
MSGTSQDYTVLGTSIAITLLAAVFGGALTVSPVRTWYRTIRKPAWNPPDAIFTPVWTVLYILIGLALWRVWRLGWDQASVRAAVILFLIQLASNVLWSGVFFGLRQPGWGFAEICVLWVLILATLVTFFRLEPLAGWLLVPYLAWVTFAAVLNYTVWRLNR